MKKLFLAVLFAVAALFSANPISEAKDVWVYTDPMESEYYVMDNTISDTVYSNGRRTVTVDVKYVDYAMERPSVRTYHYFFSDDGGDLRCERDRKSRKMFEGEWAVWNFCKSKLGWN